MKKRKETKIQRRNITFEAAAAACCTSIIDTRQVLPTTRPGTLLACLPSPSCFRQPRFPYDCCPPLPHLLGRHPSRMRGAFYSISSHPRATWPWTVWKLRGPPGTTCPPSFCNGPQRDLNSEHNIWYMEVCELKVYFCPSAGDFCCFIQVRLLEQAGEHKKLENSGFRTYFFYFWWPHDIYWLTRDIKAPAHLQVVMVLVHIRWGSEQKKTTGGLGLQFRLVFGPFRACFWPKLLISLHIVRKYFVVTKTVLRHCFWELGNETIGMVVLHDNVIKSEG